MVSTKHNYSQTFSGRSKILGYCERTFSTSPSAIISSYSNPPSSGFIVIRVQQRLSTFPIRACGISSGSDVSSSRFRRPDAQGNRHNGRSNEESAKPTHSPRTLNSRGANFPTLCALFILFIILGKSRRCFFFIDLVFALLLLRKIFCL